MKIAGDGLFLEEFFRSSWTADFKNHLRESGNMSKIGSYCLPFKFYCAEPTYSDYDYFFRDVNRKLRDLFAKRSHKTLVENTHAAAGHFVDTGRYMQCMHGLVLVHPELIRSCEAVHIELREPYWRFELPGISDNSRDFRARCAEFEQGVIRSIDTVDDDESRGAFILMGSNGGLSSFTADRAPVSAEI